MLAIRSLVTAFRCLRRFASSSSPPAPLISVPLGATHAPNTVLTGAAPVGNAGDAPRLRGATLDRRTGKWRASITVSGKRVELGLFADAHTAADAYTAAKAVYSGQQYQRRPRTVAAAEEAGAGAERLAAEPKRGRSSEEVVRVPALVLDVDDDEPAPAVPVAPGPLRIVSSRFRGVIQEGEGATLWEAVVEVNGREVSGGEYETEEEAARAYDALARMYLGSEAPVNFTADAYTAWVPPEGVVNTGQIELRLGEMLNVTEVCEALRQERGIDVKVCCATGGTKGVGR